jgi:translation elongation factor P/translation initiation factor 5A
MAKHDYYDEDSSYAQSTKSSSYGFKPVKETKATSISSVHTPSASTFTIPCHHIRIGDLVILQQRPCQIIRITTSAQTGQHRYLGVDLFTKQLHEEPCVVSHPSPSVVLHSLLGPVFKQYRLIDIRDDGKLVAMTESGEIKQGLKVVDQGNLYNKLREAYGKGSGSVRVLVIADQGKELAVDYKIVHLAHKL